MPSKYFLDKKRAGVLICTAFFEPLKKILFSLVSQVLMIDINITLVVQMINFLVLMVILHFFLYKPMKRLFDERESRIKGALAEAQSIKGRADGLLSGYDEALKHAKVEAHNIFALLSLEGSQEQKRAEENARVKATATMESAVAQVSADTAKAREILRNEVSKISGGIVSKLLGRSI